MKFITLETCLLKDFFILREGIRIAVSRCRQHGQGETGGGSGVDAVCIRDEFQCKYSPVRGECRKGFVGDLLARGQIEVMEKIGEQHDVVRAFPIEIERTSLKQRMTVSDAGSQCIFGGDGKVFGPVECREL